MLIFVQMFHHFLILLGVQLVLVCEICKRYSWWVSIGGFGIHNCLVSPQMFATPLRPPCSKYWLAQHAVRMRDLGYSHVIELVKREAQIKT